MHVVIDFKNAEAVTHTTAVSGVCAGTTILTLDGEIPVEHLSVGDRIVTRDSGMAALRDIRLTRTKIQPIRIKAGSLGHTRPDRDMIACPDTKLNIRDWRAAALFGQSSALVPAHQFIDGEFLIELSLREVAIYDLVFDQPHILYADGLEIGSA